MDNSYVGLVRRVYHFLFDNHEHHLITESHHGPSNHCLEYEFPTVGLLFRFVEDQRDGDEVFVASIHDKDNWHVYSRIIDAISRSPLRFLTAHRHERMTNMLEQAQVLEGNLGSIVAAFSEDKYQATLAVIAKHEEKIIKRLGL